MDTTSAEINSSSEASSYEKKELDEFESEMEVELFPCKYCQKALTSVGDRKGRHECNSSFQEGSEFENHEWEEEQPIIRKCRKCPMEFDVWPDYVKHQKTHIFWCTYAGCDLSFQSEKERDAHVKLIPHNTEDSSSSSGNTDEQDDKIDVADVDSDSVEMVSVNEDGREGVEREVMEENGVAIVEVDPHNENLEGVAEHKEKRRLRKFKRNSSYFS